MATFSTHPLDAYSLGYLDILKKAVNPYFRFSGRASRSEFWRYSLLTSIIQNAISVLYEITHISAVQSLVGIVGLALFIPTLAITVRRLHDTNHSGWWILVSFIPFGILWVLYLLCKQGDEQDNPYGSRTGYIQIDEALAQEKGLETTPTQGLTTKLLILCLILMVWSGSVGVSTYKNIYNPSHSGHSTRI